MKKILLVEDDEDLSDLIRTVLTQKAYKVFISHTSDEGLKMAKEEKPDLILMDILLPGMNGAEVVKNLKTVPMVRDIPVLFLTGLLSHSEKDSEEDGVHIDGKKYTTIAKPVNIPTLLSEIEKALKQK